MRLGVALRPLAGEAEAIQTFGVTSTDPAPDRHRLEQRWLHLTREALPAVAMERHWPVRADHCFQRILLDAACGGRWYDHVSGRPAYAHAPGPILSRAVSLGEACLAGTADLAALNQASLAWRVAAR